MVNDLQDFLTRQPFVPFAIHLADGTVYDVRHPELVMVGLESVIVGFQVSDEKPTTYGRTKTILHDRIAKLLPIDEPQAGTRPSYDEIRARYRREPFAPFRIEVSDGKSYDILEMGAMIVTVQKLHIGIPKKKGRGYEGVVLVPVDSVVKVTTLPSR